MLAAILTGQWSFLSGAVNPAKAGKLLHNFGHNKHHQDDNYGNGNHTEHHRVNGRAHDFAAHFLCRFQIAREAFQHRAKLARIFARRDHRAVKLRICPFVLAQRFREPPFPLGFARAHPAKIAAWASHQLQGGDFQGFGDRCIGLD